MAVVKELIRKDSDGTLSFGNYELDKKSKLSDFEFEGDLYKIKTFKEITKLERNGMFVYESVPGTVVTGMKAKADSISFTVEGTEDSSITLELEPETTYTIRRDGAVVDEMKTNLGGKLNISVELNPGQTVAISIEKSA